MKSTANPRPTSLQQTEKLYKPQLPPEDGRKNTNKYVFIPSCIQFKEIPSLCVAFLMPIKGREKNFFRVSHKKKKGNKKVFHTKRKREKSESFSILRLPLFVQVWLLPDYAENSSMEKYVHGKKFLLSFFRA